MSNSFFIECTEFSRKKRINKPTHTDNINKKRPFKQFKLENPTVDVTEFIPGSIPT